MGYAQPPSWPKVALVWLVVLSLILLTACSGKPDAWCEREKQRIQISGAALDACAQSRECVVTSESVVSLYDRVGEYARACGRPE